MSERPQLHRRLVEATPDGIWVLDEHARTVFANEQMALLLGRDHASLDDFSAFEAVDEQGHADLRAHLADMVDGHPGETNVESLFLRPDGSTIWTLLSWAPLWDGAERLGWLHRVTEYTERKELVATLQEREQQLAAAQRIAQIGSWEWDVLSDTVTWSDQLYRMYHLEPQEFAATYRGFLDFIHPDDRDLVHERVSASFTGADEFTFDARVIRTDGEQRWTRGLGVVERAPDGTPTRMTGTTQDITDLVHADQHAVAATQRLALLQQITVAANRSTSLAHALELAAEVIARLTTWVAVGAYTVVDGGPPVLTRLPAPDGRPVPVPVPAPDPGLADRVVASRRVELATQADQEHALLGIPVLLDGATVCVVELYTDEVPPSADSRSLIEQVAAQLGWVAERQRVAEQLAEARDEAMEASRLKSEFLATMSHEIRTPMNGVIGLNELLLRTELDDHQRRLTEGLQSAGLTLLGIINDILDLSKIESGKLELEEADFDVRAVFERVAAVLSGPAHEKGLELVVGCHPEVPLYLNGDSVRFGQVITNLGSNAVKFTDSGEVVVRAVVERAEAERVVLRVEVTDTGAGIEPEARDRLFEAFTQADPSTTRRHGGTGLGLAISSQLVEALGGEIAVESEVGRGSTFSFTAGFGPASSAPTPRTGSPHLLRGRRVLVVDDNRTNRFLLEQQLSAWDLAPTAVDCAEDALVALHDGLRRGEPFEIALLDLVMPVTDGLELAREIRSDPELADLELLLLSSDQGVGGRSVREAGIRAALSKPVRHSELLDALVDTVAAGLGEHDVAPARLRGPALGVTVLVVEDNHVNQLVASGLLEGFGCTVEVAGDGAEALRMLRTPHRYAAVLMDCRMPTLDGFDATRAIRARETNGERVPIIAMTASVLEGERERCLAAGMDDFLTKPVDAGDLESTVRRWLEPRPALDPAPDPAPATPRTAPPEPSGRSEVSGEPDPGGAPVLDAARVRMLDELRKDGVSFFQRTAASFLTRVGDQVRAIEAAVEAQDAAALTGSAHALKGSALNLGLPRIGAAAQRLETLGDTGRTDGAAPLLLALTHEVARGSAALRAATGPPPATS